MFGPRTWSLLTLQSSSQSYALLSSLLFCGGTKNRQSRFNSLTYANIYLYSLHIHDRYLCFTFRLRMYACGTSSELDDLYWNLRKLPLSLLWSHFLSIMSLALYCRQHWMLSTSLDLDFIKRFSFLSDGNQYLYQVIPKGVQSSSLSCKQLLGLR